MSRGRLSLAIATAVLLGSAAPTLRAQRSGPTPADTGRLVGAAWNEPLRQLGALDELPRLLRGETLLAQSSFDRTGGNDDGFSGRWSPLRRDPNGEYVLFDERGPGALARLHFAFFDSIQPGNGREAYDIRVYFDDELEPSIDLPLQEFVEGRHAPFLQPFVGNDRVSSGGPFVAYPLVFRNALRITTTGAPNFFSFQGVRYRDASRVSTYRPRYDEPGPARDLLLASTHPPAPRPGDRSALALGPVQTGQPLRVVDLIGPATIRHVVFELPPGGVEGLVLKAWWDGESAPSIDAPLGFLLGNELGSGPVRGALMGLSPADDLGWLRLPMPFASSARIELHGRATGVVRTRVDWSPGVPAGEWGTLRSQHRETLAPRPNEDVVFLEADGRGRAVAVVASMGWRNRGTPQQGRLFLEGDERIRIDGARTPQLHGTGGEEFFDWGWYDTGVDLPFTLPLHGYPERKLEAARDETASYRIFLHAPVTWERDIRLSIEHGPENREDAEYRSVALYYGVDRVGIELSDTIDVGDLGSEIAHAWNDPSGVFLPASSFDFEGELQGQLLSEEGRRAVGPFHFRVGIRPDNDGVRLRRLSDQAIAPQWADVWVDGVLVGPWYQSRSNATHRWLEDSFEIPPSLTTQKSSIEVRLVPRGARWNTYRIEAWSYLR